MEEQQSNKINISLVAGVLVVLVIIAGVLFLQASGGAYSKEAAEAVKLNSAGDYAGAQNFLLEKIKTDPAPELKLLLADSYMEEGDAKGTRDASALKTRELLLPTESSGYVSANLYYLLGYSAEAVSDFDRALAYYDKAEKAITGSTDNSVKAKVYAAQGRMNADPKKSEEYFLKALPLSASKRFKAELYANLSNARYLQSDLPKAVEYAEQAVKTDPSGKSGYIVYAKATISDKNLLQKNAKKVEEYLVKAIFLAPRSAEPQYWMGKLDASFGKYDLAIASYDTAAKFLMKDNTVGVQAKASLMSDIFFDESVSYFLKKDRKYKEFFREAFRLNPTKTLFRVRENPALKEMMTDFVSKTTK